MNKSKQYESLIEIMSHTRLLAALSDSDVVGSNMERIKLNTVNAVVELGFSEVKFNSDSIVRYRELLEQLK